MAESDRSLHAKMLAMLTECYSVPARICHVDPFWILLVVKLGRIHSKLVIDGDSSTRACGYKVRMWSNYVFEFSVSSL